jgi:hypothetical protein
MACLKWTSIAMVPYLCLILTHHISRVPTTFKALLPSLRIWFLSLYRAKKIPFLVICRKARIERIRREREEEARKERERLREAARELRAKQREEEEKKKEEEKRREEERKAKKRDRSRDRSRSAMRQWCGTQTF